MQGLIDKYLSKTYYVDTNSVSEYNIYFKGTPILVYWSDLVSEISYTFGYSDELSEIFIKNWLGVNYPNCNLQLYYLKVKPVFENVVFPIVRRVFSQTLASDLVSVQPIEQPRCNLLYLDIVYGETKWVKFKRKIIRYYKKILNGIGYKNKTR